MLRLPLLRSTEPSAEPELDPLGVGYDALGVIDYIPEVLLSDPEESVEDAEDQDAAEPGDDFAVKLLRAFLRRFENEKTRAQMLRLVRSSFESARSGRMVYRALAATFVNPLARATGVHASALRIELVVGQLMGLAMMRYVLKVEPLASASVDELIASMAPSIRATLKS